MLMRDRSAANKSNLRIKEIDARERKKQTSRKLTKKVAALVIPM